MYVHYSFNSGDSPRVAVHNKKDVSQTPSMNQKKTEDKNMPPKIPKPPNQGGINYKLPPRPASRQQPQQPQVNSSRNNNQSYDYYNRDRRSSSR